MPLSACGAAARSPAGGPHPQDVGGAGRNPADLFGQFEVVSYGIVLGHCALGLPGAYR